MKSIFILMIPILMTTEMFFDFNAETDLANWYIVDDGVMGGLSQGNFQVNKEGHGQFSGDVSLENNGGFSMVQYYFERKEVKAFDYIVIKLKGDGKQYQFRVKVNEDDRHSYIINFETTGEWQELKVPMKDLAPAYRGRALEMPYFPNSSMQMMAFLIGNKKAESFKLIIDSIELQ